MQGCPNCWLTWATFEEKTLGSQKKYTNSNDFVNQKDS